MLLMLLFSLVVSKDKVWRDQFYDGHPNKERSKIYLIKTIVQLLLPNYYFCDH